MTKTFTGTAEVRVGTPWSIHVTLKSYVSLTSRSNGTKVTTLNSVGYICLRSNSWLSAMVQWKRPLLPLSISSTVTWATNDPNSLPSMTSAYGRWLPTVLTRILGSLSLTSMTLTMTSTCDDRLSTGPKSADVTQ